MTERTGVMTVHFDQPEWIHGRGHDSDGGTWVNVRRTFGRS